MKFKDNPIKALREMKQSKGRCCMDWLRAYHNDIWRPIENKIEALKKALRFYDQYKRLNFEYKQVKKIFKKYEKLYIGWR